MCGYWKNDQISETWRQYLQFVVDYFPITAHSRVLIMIGISLAFRWQLIEIIYKKAFALPTRVCELQWCHSHPCPGAQESITGRVLWVWGMANSITATLAPVYELMYSMWKRVDSAFRRVIVLIFSVMQKTCGGSASRASEEERISLPPPWLEAVMIEDGWLVGVNWPRWNNYGEYRTIYIGVIL